MKRIYLLAILPLVVLGGCGREKHFITDKEYRNTVEQDFQAKQQLLANAPENLFAVFDQSLTLEEREALQFLYAYSPLIDLTYTDGDFLLSNVRHTFRVREEMPWGKEIPEAIFRYFVLPVRGSNESLDSSRMVFYRKLRDRVLKCKTMEDAALEVNHWCHEKAIYKPTNARTVSPLAMMSTAYGRCGEESVFALAALRSVGIPARQVYTPRWAHCDDNHAWIEVWVDGTWKYLGACEPEPRLDIAWFTAPVRRGLLMQARVFGKYLSDEEVVSENANGTVVNVTGNYTDVKKLTVKVRDTEGKPVAGANVQYKIYNYGEYYPVAAFRTDGKGEVSLIGGLGDWIVWATDGKQYGFAELKAADSHEVIVTLDKGNGENYIFRYEIVPPTEKEYQAIVSDGERGINDRRFMYEDSLRNAYIAAFTSETAVRRLAEHMKVDADKLVRIVKGSRGNCGQIIRFMLETELKWYPVALEMLDVMQGKDWQDTPADVLNAHLDAALRFRNDPLYPEYRMMGMSYNDLFRECILNPRVKNELITPWRQPLLRYLASKDIGTVEALLKDMENIKVADEVNTINIATPPESVLTAMVTDTRSKELFFVAACRTLGIAARLNPIDGKPEFHRGKGWIPVVFVDEATVAPQGELMVEYCGKEVKDPAYYTHFTISKITGGIPVSIDLGSNAQVDMGGGAAYSSIFRAPVSLEEGDYILTTGNRRSDGSVLSVVKAFSVKRGERTRIEMEVTDTNEELKIWGTIDTNIRFVPEGGNVPRKVDFPDKGYTAFALIAVNQEPTNHLIRDMSVLKTEFEEKGVSMTFLFTDAGQLDRFSRLDFRPLPETMSLGYDYQGEAAAMLTEKLQLKNPGNLPLIVMVNRKGEVVFISQGYRIGLGTQIMKVMNY